MSGSNKKATKSKLLPDNTGSILAGRGGGESADWSKAPALIKGIIVRLLGSIGKPADYISVPAIETPSPELLKRLQAVALLMKFQLDPSGVDQRRSKKRACLTEEETALRAAALDAFRSKDPQYIMPWISKALAEGDPSVFNLLAQAAGEVKSPAHTESSRRVLCALEAEIKLLESLGRIPTKQEIRLESGMELEPVRWTEIHKAAGQANNPAGKAKRGQERHGDTNPPGRQAKQ